MQTASADRAVHPGVVHPAPSSKGGVRAGTASAVRLLTAVILLGSVLLLVALAGQGTAAAQPLPRGTGTPDPDPGTGTAPVPAGRGPAVQPDGPDRTAAPREILVDWDQALRTLKDTGTLPAAASADRGGRSAGSGTPGDPRQPDLAAPDLRMTSSKRPEPADTPVEVEGDGDGPANDPAVRVAAATQPPEPSGQEQPATQKPALDINHTATQLQHSARMLADEGRRLTAYRRDTIGKLVQPDPQSDPHPMVSSIRERATSAITVQKEAPQAAQYALTDAARELSRLARSMSEASNWIQKDAETLGILARIAGDKLPGSRDTLGLMGKPTAGRLNPEAPGPPLPPPVGELPKGFESKFVKDTAAEMAWDIKQVDRYLTEFSHFRPLVQRHLGRYIGPALDAAAKAGKVADDPYSAEAQAAMGDAIIELQALSDALQVVATAAGNDHVKLRTITVATWNIAAHYRHLLGDPEAPELEPLDPPFPPDSVGTPWERRRTPQGQQPAPEGQPSIPEERQPPPEEQQPPERQDGSLDTRHAGGGPGEQQAPAAADAGLDRTPLEQTAFEAPHADAPGSDSLASSATGETDAPLSNEVQVAAASSDDPGSGDAGTVTPGDGGDVASLDASLDASLGVGDLSFDAATV